MSDGDNYMPTPKSPVESEEPITLTSDQIQHVSSFSVFSAVAHYTNTVWKEHRRVQTVDDALCQVCVFVHTDL